MADVWTVYQFGKAKQKKLLSQFLEIDGLDEVFT